MPTIPFSNAVPIQIGNRHDWVYGSGPDESVYALSERNEGYIITENHGRRRKGRDNGGPFLLMKRGYESEPSEEVVAYRPHWGETPIYTGRFTAEPWEPDYFLFNQSALGHLSDHEAMQFASYKYGAEAWKRALATLTVPDFQPLQPIVELRELLPGLLKRTKEIQLRVRGKWKESKEYKRAKKRGENLKPSVAGEIHLGLQFGLLPLVGDMCDFLIAYKNGEKRANQLIRDNGAPVRRRGTLFNKEESTSFRLGGSTTNMKPVLITQSYANDGWRECNYRSTDKAWYSGKFRYFLPPWDYTQVQYQKKLQSMMYGNFTPSASTLYNLVPWSWMFDWFTDLGNFFDAVSYGVADLVYAEYFYVMRNTRTEYSVEPNVWVYTARDASSYASISPKTRMYYEVKSRSHATPFGFGLSEDSLTPRQLAIAGALGLSRT